MTVTYLRLELLRTYRNIRYLLLTLSIPVILFLVIGGAFDNQRVLGVSGQTWYMINMATFGALGAVLGVGVRIAVERDAGWNRQLRLTPLPPEGYVVGKVIVGMLLALPSLLLVCATGFLTGEVHLAALQWVEVIGLGWVALLPMSAVGVGLGYLARGDTAQAVNGGAVMLLSMFGGVWFPVDDSSPQWLQSVAHVIPTYWITQISRAPLTHDWPAVSGWLVLAAWTFVGIRIAARRYLADDLRAA
jgi:ABC-2 type transport system permease protein